MTITQSSLQQDAQDNLEKFYAQEAELVAQIKTFEEALETARDNLRALRKDWKIRLRRAGRYRSIITVIENYVKEHGPINRRECVQHVLSETNEERKLIESTINTCLEKGTVSLDTENVLRFTNRERVYTFGLSDDIIAFIKNQNQPVTIDDITQGVNSNNKASVRSCIKRLILQKQITKLERYRGRDKCLYSYCEPLPKQEPKQCDSTAVGSSISL